MTDEALSGLPPTHPGEILREDVIPATGLPKTQIAKMLGVSRQTLHDILTERQPVTSRMALRLARMFGGSPEIWVRMQASHDFHVYRTEMAAELAAIPVVQAAA